MRLVLLITLLLMSPLAYADKGDDHCRKVHGHGVAQDYQEACEFDGIAYDFCFINKMRGTLNGTMFEYFQDDWVALLEAEGLPTPPEAIESWYNREFAVLSTKKGKIWGEAQYVFDLRNYDTGGGVAVPMIITGGTGKFKNAYGWVTWIYSDDLTKFSLDGRVCGSKIPHKHIPYK